MAAGKLGILVIGALLLGFLVGAWTSRLSYRGLQKELDEVRTELEEAKKRQRQFTNPVALGLQKLLEQRDRPSFPRTTTPPPLPEVTPFPPQAKSDATPASAGHQGPDNGELDQDKQREMLETAADTWRLRQTQVRAAFLEAADLDDKQRASLDRLVDRLNQDVRELVGEAVEKWNFDEPPRTRDAVDFGVALGSVYQEIDDELRQVLTEEQMAAGREVNFDIFTQIDPDLFMPFVTKMESRR